MLKTALFPLTSPLPSFFSSKSARSRAGRYPHLYSPHQASLGGVRTSTLWEWTRLIVLVIVMITILLAAAVAAGGVSVLVG